VSGRRIFADIGLQQVHLVERKITHLGRSENFRMASRQRLERSLIANEHVRRPPLTLGDFRSNRCDVLNPDIQYASSTCSPACAQSRVTVAPAQDQTPRRTTIPRARSGIARGRCSSGSAHKTFPSRSVSETRMPTVTTALEARPVWESYVTGLSDAEITVPLSVAVRIRTGLVSDVIVGAAHDSRTTPV